jgi:hypothetical protein
VGLQTHSGPFSFWAGPLTAISETVQGEGQEPYHDGDQLVLPLLDQLQLLRFRRSPQTRSTILELAGEKG